MNPILLSFGPIQIHWYSFFMALGLLIGGYMVLKETKKHGILEDNMIDFFFVLLPISFVGARLYFVVFHLDYYLTYPIDIIKVWEGGLAIHGGIIVGLLTAFIFCKKKNLNFLQIVDIAVPGVILAQSFGRWGNFYNGEAHGAVTTLETLRSLKIPEFIINGMKIDDVYYYPTFYFESIWCIIGFIIMVILRKNKKIKTGFITGFYFIWYGIGRFFIESSRTDSLMLFNIKVAQLVSIIGIIVGIIFIIYSFKSKKDIKEE